MKCILGKKIGMSQIFGKEGEVIPATLIEAGPCFISQIKNQEKDGYEAVQMGFQEAKKISMPQAGHLKKTGKNLKYLKEFICEDMEKGLKAGDKIDASVFKEGDFVNISGVSKGKGFAGVIKRWNFNRKPATHGAKHEERAMGSVGCRFPQRVVKGRKMPGRLGSERVTVKNLEITKVDVENNLIAVKGAVPGRKGTLLEIRG